GHSGSVVGHQFVDKVLLQTAPRTRPTRRAISIAHNDFRKYADALLVALLILTSAHAGPRCREGQTNLVSLVLPIGSFSLGFINTPKPSLGRPHLLHALVLPKLADPIIPDDLPLLAAD